MVFHFQKFQKACPKVSRNRSPHFFRALSVFEILVRDPCFHAGCKALNPVGSHEQVRSRSYFVV